MKLGVAVSGQGTNLRNLVERGFEVVAVVTNRPSCAAAQFARGRGLAVGDFPQRRFASAADRDAAMAGFLREQGVELLVCAGYDRVFTRPLFDAFGGRIINIHPSLLPAFGGGMDAVAQALRAGVEVTGCTVHHVIEAVDAGPVILQSPVAVLPGDTEEALRARIQAEEHRLLPRAIVLVSDAARAAVGQ
jgi:phosphoribosylglycinamide formyltransferase-1